jgi:5-methylcytosine-specific restriction enzyme A
MKCALCDREIVEGLETEHHLVPRVNGGNHGACVFLHEICHKQVHALFTNKDLSKRLNTIEKLKEHKDIQRFLGWIADKSPEFNTKIRLSKRNR